MLKHLTFKELLKFVISCTFFLFLNFSFTYIFNQTDKYILIKSHEIFDFIYINKDLGFLLFLVIYLSLVITTIVMLEKIYLNYDHMHIKLYLNIFLILSAGISILNFKRNLLLHGLLSDHLVFIVSIFISYCYYFWNNLNNLYRVIKIPFVFINSSNEIYIKFQYTYLWIYLYVLFSLIFLSQMIPSFDFYYVLILVLLFDIIIKNVYLYYKNTKIAAITTVTIIRHGQTNANLNGNIQGWTDNPLNEHGEAEIANISKKITPIYDVYQCTPLIRSYQSLDIITTNLNIITATQLNEYAIERNFGELEMKWRDNENKNYFENYDGYINGKKYNNFESNKKLLKRAKKYLKFTKKYYKGNNILIVSHSHFIKAVLTQITQENYFAYKIPNASISHFDIYPNEIIVTKTDICEYKHQDY